MDGMLQALFSVISGEERYGDLKASKISSKIIIWGSQALTSLRQKKFGSKVALTPL
jgi:hypothetical protein